MLFCAKKEIKNQLHKCLKQQITTLCSNNALTPLASYIVYVTQICIEDDESSENLSV